MNTTPIPENDPEQPIDKEVATTLPYSAWGDPRERDCSQVQIHSLQRELELARKECARLEAERDEAIHLRERDNRSIRIACHYQDNCHQTEDGRIRPALVMEKAVAVAIDAWADGNAVTIKLCPEEVEQWVALVCVHSQGVTAFSLDEMSSVEREPEEVWLSSAVLAALDQTLNAVTKRAAILPDLPITEAAWRGREETWI